MSSEPEHYSLTSTPISQASDTILTSLPSSIPSENNSAILPLLERQSSLFNATFPENAPSERLELNMSSYNSPSSDDTPLHPATRQQVISITEVHRIISQLRNHRVNTLTELRRHERVLTSLENFLTENYPYMADAWSHYVNSNNLLNELRGLTRQFPFSTQLLEEAKRRVYNDTRSNSSWNMAWLVLAKIKTDGLVRTYATSTAYQSDMWGGIVPEPANADELARVLTGEWTRAVDNMLRHWPTPPTVDGRW